MRAPTTGFPPRNTRPLTVASFELAACQRASGTAPPCSTMRAFPSLPRPTSSVARPPRADGGHRVGLDARARRCPRAVTAGKREHLEPRRNAAVRRRRSAADGDRDVFLAARGEDRRPARDRAGGVERPEDLARLERERPDEAIATARKPEARRSQRHTSALGLGRRELPDPTAGRHVDGADRAVVVPILERPSRSCRSRGRGRRRRARTSASSASASASSGSARAAVSAAALKT